MKNKKAIFTIWCCDDYDPKDSTSIFGDEFSCNVSDLTVLYKVLHSRPFDKAGFVFCLNKIAQECDLALDRQLS